MTEVARQLVERSYQHPVQWEQLSVVELLRQLKLPMLLIHDRDDQEIPFEHSLQLSLAMPAAQFMQTSGLGHRRVLKDQAVITRIAQFAQFAPKTGTI